MMHTLIHAIPYVIGILFLVWITTTIYGLATAKELPESMREEESDRPSFFTESDRTKQLREAYVQRHQAPEPLDRLAIAIKRERAELMAVRK